MTNPGIESAEMGPVFSSPRAGPGADHVTMVSKSTVAGSGTRDVAAAPEWLMDRLDQLEFAIAHFGARGQGARGGQDATRLDRLERLIEQLSFQLDERDDDGDVDGDAALTGLAVSLARIEAQMGALSDRLTALETGLAQSPEDQKDEGVSATLSALQQALGPDGALSAQGQTVLQYLESLPERVLSQLPERSDASSDLAALADAIRVITDRLDTLEQRFDPAQVAQQLDKALNQRFDTLSSAVAKLSADLVPTMRALSSRAPAPQETSATAQGIARLSAALSTLSRQQGQIGDRLEQRLSALAEAIDTANTAGQQADVLCRVEQTLAAQLSDLGDRLLPIAAAQQDAARSVEGLREQVGGVADELSGLRGKVVPALETLVARPAPVVDMTTTRQGFARLATALSAMARQQGATADRIEDRVTTLQTQLAPLVEAQGPDRAAQDDVATRLESLVQSVHSLSDRAVPALETLVARPVATADTGAATRQSLARISTALSAMSKRQGEASERLETRVTAIEAQLGAVSGQLGAAPETPLAARIDEVVARLADLRQPIAPMQAEMTDAKDIPGWSTASMTLTKMSGQLAAVLVRLNALNRLTEGQAAEIRLRLGDMARGEDLGSVRGDLAALRDGLEDLSRKMSDDAHQSDSPADFDQAAVLRDLRTLVAEMLADAQRRAAIAAE